MTVDRIASDAFGAMAEEYEPVAGMRQVLARRREGSGPRRHDTMPWREALDGDPRFGPLSDEEAVHEHRTARERIVAMIASWSSIGGLPEEDRDAALAAVRDVLERHAIDETEIALRSLITTARRLDG